MSYNNIIRLDNLEMMSEEELVLAVQNANTSSSIFNYDPFYGCQVTCSCQCNHIETQTIPEPDDRYYVDLTNLKSHELK